jgi:hypothetical protein
MSIQNETGRAGNSADLENTSTLDNLNCNQTARFSQAKNDPARVIEARRDLLRDYGHEVAIQAADYAGIVANFISADDTPGLQYAAAKFIALARETARTCRELIDTRAPL